MIGIYKITNTINGRVYIGQAQDIEFRWKRHERDSKTENQVIYRAMRKYGIENFSFEVVEECSIEELDEKEIYYIEQYRSYVGWKDSNGYNMTLGGGGSRGVKVSKESRQKMGDSRRGEKNHNYGKPMTKEAKEKLRRAKIGKTLSDYHKRRISESLLREKNPFYGKTHTEETKKKMRENHADIKGGKNPKAKKVICEGVVYDCLKDCAEFYGINYDTMKWWLSKRGKVRQDFIEKGLKYLD